jgi:hypothetical protein
MVLKYRDIFGLRKNPRGCIFVTKHRRVDLFGESL